MLSEVSVQGGSHLFALLPGADQFITQRPKF
jgi:hypothetical protein